MNIGPSLLSQNLKAKSAQKNNAKENAVSFKAQQRDQLPAQESLLSVHPIYRHPRTWLPTAVRNLNVTVDNPNLIVVPHTTTELVTEQELEKRDAARRGVEYKPAGEFSIRPNPIFRHPETWLPTLKRNINPTVGNANLIVVPHTTRELVTPEELRARDLEKRAKRAR